VGTQLIAQVEGGSQGLRKGGLSKTDSVYSKETGVTTPWQTLAFLESRVLLKTDTSSGYPKEAVFILFLFLASVEKTQLNQWTRRVFSTRLID